MNQNYPFRENRINYEPKPPGLAGPGGFKNNTLMKTLIITLFIGLLGLAACKKEDTVSKNITGKVYEAGTNYPVRNADVFLIAEGSGFWPKTEILSRTRTGENGYFSLENLTHLEYNSRHISAVSHDYYSLEGHNSTINYKVLPNTATMNIMLERKSQINVRLIRNNQKKPGDNVRLQSNYQIIDWRADAILDTTIQLKTAAFVYNQITATKTSNGITSTEQLSFYDNGSTNDTLKINY